METFRRVLMVVEEEVLPLLLLGLMMARRLVRANVEVDERMATRAGDDEDANADMAVFWSVVCVFEPDRCVRSDNTGSH